MSEILGVLFAIFIGILVIPKFATYQTISNDNIRAAATAQQQKQLDVAATAYIQQNSAAVQTTATATTPAVISIAMLQAVNLLPASFSATNPYGQTWQVEVLQPTAGNLQALTMSTGGTALLDKQATNIASIVGASGGFIPQNDSGIYAGGPATAIGAFAGWTLPTANYTGVTGGHPAALLTFNNGQLVDNRLYRNLIPGQPQLNQMNTPLVMASVQVVGSACALGAIARDSNGLILTCPLATLLWTSVSVGSCTAGSYAALPGSGNTNGKICITTDYERAYAWNGASWLPLAVDQNGNLNVPGALTAAGGTATIDTSGNLTLNQSGATNVGYINPGWAVETWGCSANGSIAKSAYNIVDGWAWNGKTLTCQGGVWSSAVTASTITASGNITTPGAVVGGYFLPTIVATAGTGCWLNGTMAAASTGAILSCQSGVWRQSSTSFPGTLTTYSIGAVAWVNVGWAYFCQWRDYYDNTAGWTENHIQATAGPDASGRWNWQVYHRDASNTTYILQCWS